jgi:hemerythrin-like domain-containing protein
MNPTPIKRSKNLIPLSKDHHEGLLTVWKIRQGFRNETAEKRIADFVLHAFETHFDPHFIEEEELLFSQLQDDDKLLVKATEQHAAIRKMVAELKTSATPTTAQLEAFADLLEQHIRFEERELFGHLESEVAEEVMNAIGVQLIAIHNQQQPLDWKDEFWIRK